MLRDVQRRGQVHGHPHVVDASAAGGPLKSSPDPSIGRAPRSARSTLRLLAASICRPVRPAIGRRRALEGSSESAPPVLVRQVRNGIEESVHRGDIVEVDVTGRMSASLGDPDHVVNLRSCVKPFGVVALLEAGGLEAFELEPAELAIMASSHSGEDLHVRTLQAHVPPDGRQPGAARDAARRACRSMR